MNERDISRLKEENKLVQSMDEMTRMDAFTIWYGLKLCKLVDAAREAYDTCDLHDPIAAAELRGRHEAYNDIKKMFTNTATMVKVSNEKLGTAVREHELGGSMRGIVPPKENSHARR